MAMKRGAGCLTAGMFACLLLVGVWEVAALLARRGSDPLRVSAADFRGFVPNLAGYSVRALPLGNDPLQPNVAAYEIRQYGDADAQVVIGRLVHGYNVVDCMRIKHFTEELLADSRGAVLGGIGNSTGLPRGTQTWLFSAEGKSRVWVVAMLHGGDLSWTAVDTRSMAFPRVGTPDSRSWNPTGLSWGSLRHPIRNLRLFLRAKWNASRCDLLTFLSLRRPAWVTDKYFTLVVEGGGDGAEPLESARQLGTLAQQLQSEFQTYGREHQFLAQ